jgi:hypothetical protein
MLAISAKKYAAVLLTAFTIIVVLSPLAFAKNKAAEKERLKMSANKISVMNEFLFFPKTNTQKKMSYQTFSADGNKLSAVELDNEEKEIKKTEYKYDSKNNEISFIEYDGDGSMRQKCESRYDEVSGSLTGELFYNAAGAPAYKRIPKPDRNANIAEQSLYDKNNKFLGKSTYKYDTAGNRIEATSYDAANNFNGRYAYSYDKKGNLTESLSYDKNNKFSGKKIFNYDQKGLLIESIGYNAAGTANSWRKYEYEYPKEIAAAVKPPVTAPVPQPVAQPQPQTVNQPQPGTEPQKTAATVQNDPAAQQQPEIHAETNADSGERLQPATHSGPIDIYNPDVSTKVSHAELINLAAMAKVETIKGLLENNGIDLNSQNERGQTALMVAACRGNEKVVEFILKQGVDLKTKEFNGLDALEYAKISKNQNVVNMIKSHMNN